MLGQFPGQLWHSMVSCVRVPSLVDIPVSCTSVLGVQQREYVLRYNTANCTVASILATPITV